MAQSHHYSSALRAVIARGHRWPGSPWNGTLAAHKRAWQPGNSTLGSARMERSPGVRRAPAPGPLLLSNTLLMAWHAQQHHRFGRSVKKWAITALLIRRPQCQATAKSTANPVSRRGSLSTPPRHAALIITSISIR